MVAIRHDTAQLLDAVEQHAGHTLRYRNQILVLLELSTARRQERLFEDLIFVSKFLWNSYNLMRRTEPGTDGYPNLAAEFRDSMEKFTTLVKTLIKEGPGAVKGSFKEDFFTLSPETPERLIRLAQDLSWLKNYSIDTKHPLFEQ